MRTLERRRNARMRRFYLRLFHERWDSHQRLINVRLATCGGDEFVFAEGESEDDRLNVSEVANVLLMMMIII